MGKFSVSANKTVHCQYDGNTVRGQELGSDFAVVFFLADIIENLMKVQLVIVCHCFSAVCQKVITIFRNNLL